MSIQNGSKKYGIRAQVQSPHGTRVRECAIDSMISVQGKGKAVRTSGTLYLSLSISLLIHTHTHIHMYI